MPPDKIYFDGAYYPDTGKMFSLVFFANERFLYSTGSECKSSTHAEWISAITALEFAAERKLSNVVLLGDSRNVIEAMLSKQGAHGIQAGFAKQAAGLCSDIGRVDWRWISSADNPAGKVLRELGDPENLPLAQTVWSV